jgi:5,10-methylenetetrahydrofolate reductase
VNKVVAHLSSPQALETWLSETIAAGIVDVVLVGGSSRYIPYPGPPVIEANRICQKILKPKGGHVGNIAIPQRTGEAHRMLSKTRAGASFFTTQIVLDDEAVLRMIREYDRLCTASGLPPASVLVSVAAIADEGDAEFVRWLGADIPEATERRILEEESEAVGRSVELALSLIRHLGATLREAGASVPLGVNVEQISQRHLEPALQMVESFAPVLAAL